VLSAAIDITDRKKAERQSAALRQELAHRGRVVMLDALTASLAHEISQPLSAIMSNAHAALRRLDALLPMADDVREILQDVLTSSRHAGDVIQRIRTLLRKTEPRRERVDLNDTVTTVVKLVDSHIADRRITLVTELAPMTGPVMGDHVQIQQVVLNLLMNAFDAAQACEQARRQVRLDTMQSDHTAVVEVSDQGAGLADDVLAEIFEPFYTTKREGIGLGLWICREIVTTHGGTLTARRNPAGGMTFRATFPLYSTNEEPESVAHYAH
jgi:C4-dicarboxylate-specific signal transduction histidine kinase